MMRRLSRMRDEDERGSILLYVLMITTITMVLVATVAIPNISRSRQSQDAAGAMTAARSGIDDVVAYLSGIPSCRSESRICPAAFDPTSTDANPKPLTTAYLAANGKARPTGLGNGQTFSWSIGPKITVDGFLRVTSTGRSGTTTRKLVADLALRPSILAYGYYTDYEAVSPQFLTSFYKPRSIYLTDCSGASVSCSSSSPRYANWVGPSNPNVCAQHWYAEGSLPGRATLSSLPVNETGKFGSTTSTTTGTTINGTRGCDLVFSSSMVQNGKTFTRDAILTSGSGPRFNQPVYTMWGYDDGTRSNKTPGFPAAGQYYRGTTMTSTPNLPQIAADDLVLPKTIGTDGIPENACVFYGPTRAKLNGDGTATITSPMTRTKYAASDSGCYPANVSGGVVGWRFDYRTYGGGAIVVRNSGTAPAAGWPANPTRSTQTPSADNELFYFTAPGSTDVTAHPDKTASPPYAGCTSSVKYSAAVDAPCAWTTVGVTTEGSSSLGWTSYTRTACSSSATTNRQLFECEYAGNTSTTTTGSPAVDQAGGKYKTLRDLIQSDVTASSCLTGTAAATQTCLTTLVNDRLKVANTGGTVAGTSTSGAHRYQASVSVGTPATSTVATGATGAGPNGTTADSFFTQPTPAKETVTKTPFVVSVKRQTYSNGWGSDTTAMSFAATQADYTYTAARGSTYFPNEDDVTDYNTGTNAAGTATRGTGLTPQTGDRQPGDLYVDGGNKGKLSLVADNDVVITGDITNPGGYTPDTDAVSIAGGQDVRNYHPVTCVDQTPADINNTTTGWCPNDITGLSSSNTYPSINDYTNLLGTGDRTIQAAVFALSGSFGTDNYTRAAPLGNLNIIGGLYQSHRGGNGVVSGSTNLAGATLQYTYQDLQRAELPYVPPSTSGNDVRPWNVVSLSSG